MNVLELAKWFMRPVTIYGRGEVDATAMTATTGLGYGALTTVEIAEIAWNRGVFK